MNSTHTRLIALLLAPPAALYAEDLGRPGADDSLVADLVLNTAQSWVSDLRNNLRTPLGLIDEGSGHFTRHYTGYSDLPGGGKYGSVGVLRLKLACW